MNKKRVSLEEQMGGFGAPVATDGEGSATVVVLSQPVAAKAEKATVYLPRAAMKRLKQMALDQDKRLNDLLQEGVDLMLAKYGQPSLQEFDNK